MGGKGNPDNSLRVASGAPGGRGHFRVSVDRGRLLNASAAARVNARRSVAFVHDQNMFI